MKKTGLALTFLLAFITGQAQIEQYGPYIGLNVFGYKSNLYNAEDLASDSVQKYKMTFGFSGGFDFGYRALNGISISSGISFGTCNQNYSSTDSIVGDIVAFKATTKMSYLKIPVVVTMQTRNEKPVKAYYSLGLFYSYNTGASDEATWDYTHNAFSPDLTLNIKGETIEKLYSNDKTKYEAKVNERPYRRHGWGGIFALGLSKQYSKKGEWFAQAKIEYQISSSENTDELTYTPTPGSMEPRRTDHVWGNYAKFMPDNTSAYSRPATHPYCLGINIGIRRYLYDFD
ncbi:MAG TPA: outer membrane beta-barrel protein [Chitinophagaceae bacterium]|nr:outer membrane beta-barrel protein [Chitinophagaceae bacterium]